MSRSGIRPRQIFSNPAFHPYQNAIVCQGCGEIIDTPIGIFWFCGCGAIHCSDEFGPSPDSSKGSRTK